MDNNKEHISKIFDKIPPLVIPGRNRHSRNRSRNFTQYEKKLLVTLVADFIPIIEHKRSDNETVAKKNWVWEQIAQKFNGSIKSPHKTALQLRNFWTSLKVRARNSMKKKKHPGSSVIPRLTPLDLKILHLVASAKGGPSPPQIELSDSDEDFPRDSNDETVSITLESTSEMSQHSFDAQIGKYLDDVPLPPLSPVAPSTTVKAPTTAPEPTLASTVPSPIIEDIKTPVPLLTTTTQESSKPESVRHSISGEKKRKISDLLLQRAVKMSDLKRQRNEELKNAKLEVYRAELRIKEKQLEETKRQSERNEIMFELERRKKELEVKMLENQYSELLVERMVM